MLCVQEIHQEQNGTNIWTNAWEETKRRRPWSPLESGDNLELDTTDFLDKDGVKYMDLNIIVATG